MKKKLIIAILLVSLLLAAAVGVLLYLENRPAADPEGTSAPSEALESTFDQETTAPVEDIPVISLPTENPDEVTPEYTFPEDDSETEETAAPAATEGTYDPDENETPEMEDEPEDTI